MRRVDRILPGSVAMIDSRDRRSGRLFSPATHRRGQQVLPGFEDQRHGPALPLALYHLGNETPDRGGGHGAPLALRLFVEAVLCVPMDRRDGLRPVDMSVTLRELRDKLYPDSRRSTAQVLRELTHAADALDTRDARIPWEDPATGQGGLRRVVSVQDLPRGETHLDDVLSLVVNLPPGTGSGPVMPETLARWGLRSAPAYNLIINLSYRLFDPGRTRYPRQAARTLDGEAETRSLRADKRGRDRRRRLSSKHKPQPPRPSPSRRPGPGGSARGPRVPHRASKPHRVPRHACVAAAPRGRLLLAARATRFPLAVQLPRFVAQLLRFS